MIRFRVALVLLILCALLFSACATSENTHATAEKDFLKDIDFIVADIQVMYDEADARDVHWPILHIAFADIDFDSIPEFFYGYQTITGSHNKIWYRAYSIKERAMIASEHSACWNTYLDDQKCSFFTGPDNFIEGYYPNDKAEPCIVTKTYVGSVTGMWTEYVFINYTDSKLIVDTGYECDKTLVPLEQVWSLTTIDEIKDDIIKLLREYSGNSEQ